MVRSMEPVSQRKLVISLPFDVISLRRLEIFVLDEFI